VHVEGQTEGRTYYGKENGLVVSPGEQHSGIQVILHCSDELQNNAHRHNRSQEGAERRKAEVHMVSGEWGMFEGVKRWDSS